jgi:hypothetical protein
MPQAGMNARLQRDTALRRWGIVRRWQTARRDPLADKRPISPTYFGVAMMTEERLGCH